MEKAPPRGKDLSKENMKFTSSGIPVKVKYGPEDLKNFDYQKDLGDPGEYPFTRGVYPTMFRYQPWMKTICTSLDLAEETNAKIKFLMKEGQSAYFGKPVCHLVFDMPTNLGLDSDHPMSHYDVGVSGPSVDTLKDIEMILEGIPLDTLYTSYNLNAPGPILLAMHLAVAEKQGVPLQKLSGIICNGGLRGYMGLQIPVFPPQGNLRMVVDTIEYCTKNVPNFIPTNMVGDMCEAGATPVQEVAFGLAMFREITRAVLKKGLEIDEFASTFAGWYTVTLREFFEQIAKVRALRRMWATMMKEEFGAKDPRSWRLKVSSHTPGGSVLTREEPLNNIARVAIAVLGNVLAGVQAIHSCSYDEGYDIPTREASLVALRTQQIIEDEIGVKDIADPLGGSYFIESLTGEIEKEANKYVARIEEMGGYIAAIENGYIQQEIANAAYRQQEEVEKREKIIIGVNKYHSDIVTPIKLVERNPRTRDIVLERLEEVKKKRDSNKVKESLKRVKEAATGSENLIPFFLEAVKNYATMGEIMSVLKEVFGDYDTSNLGKFSTC